MAKLSLFANDAVSVIVTYFVGEGGYAFLYVDFFSVAFGPRDGD